MGYEDKNKNTSQLWRFFRQSDGSYLIQNARTGKYIAYQYDKDDEGKDLVSSGTLKQLDGKEGIFGDDVRKLAYFTLDRFAGEDNPVNFNYSADWMADIPNDALVSSINIPGTHDTGTASVNFDASGQASLSSCQKYYYGEQLNVGARSFDIRCDADNDDASLDEINIVHGSSLVVCHERGTNFTPLTLKSLLDDSIRFLNNHSSETIILTIKRDAGSEVGLAKALGEFIKDNKRYFWTEDSIPTMGEARGKIILFRRYKVDYDYVGAGVELKWFGPDLTNWDNYSYSDYEYMLKYVPSDSSEKPAYKAVTVTVKPKKITVKAVPGEKVYGTKTVLDFQTDEEDESNALVADDTKEDLKLTLMAVDTEDSSIDGDRIKSPVGLYEIQKKECGNDNYEVTVVPAEFRILRKAVSLVWSEQTSFEYTGDPVNVTAVAKGLLPGDVCEVNVENGDRIQPGTYVAKAVSLTNDNYKLPDDESLLNREYVINGSASDGDDNDGGANDDGAGPYDTDSIETAGPVEKMTFTNTYTKSVANPSDPEGTTNGDSDNDNESKTDAGDSAQTGDNTSLAAWIALMLLSGAGIGGVTLYTRRKRTNE